VYVVGEVNEPGVQAITDIALTAVEAISQAGDVTANSDMKNVTLTRDNITYDIDLVSMYELGATDQNIILQDGDILNVPDRNLQKVFVLGSVNSPSTQIIHKGRLSLAEAISDAGGFDETGSNPSQVFVVRGGEIEPQIYHIDARSPGALVIADSFQLQARDIVYVERSGEVRLAERLERLSVLTRMVNDIADTRIRVVEDLN
jgi:polysaccharide export outer membrane protein